MSKFDSVIILELIRDTNKHVSFQCAINALNDAINSLNEHDSLVAEVERLKQEAKDWENKYYDSRRMYDAEIRRISDE